jgi:lysophospholipid hydrolase
MADGMASMSEKFFDLTFPLVSYFNGDRFNQSIMKIIGEKTRIQDLILSFFCVSTDLCHNGQAIHTKGSCWKYVRASMSLQGYLPPISEGGSLLLDGGYTNLVPGDVMSEHMGAQTVIAVDVSPEKPIEYFEYGTNLSGFWLLLNSWNPFAKTVRVPSMGELSQKLIWVSSIQHLNTVVNKHVDLFIVPPVEQYGTLEYDKFDEIFEKGYEDAKPRVKAFIEKRPWLVS